MMQIQQYSCPKCDASLLTDEGVKLIVRTPTQESAEIYLSPKPGDYTYTCVPVINLIHGVRLDFSCPACYSDLTSPKHSDFVELLMVVTSEIKFEVEFSRIAGDRRTYVITEEYIEKHGDNPPDFERILGLD